MIIHFISTKNKLKLNKIALKKTENRVLLHKQRSKSIISELTRLATPTPNPPKKKTEKVEIKLFFL